VSKFTSGAQLTRWVCKKGFLPIVVHVVHLGEAIGVETNISDEQILSMVDNLNHRFRGDINALTSLTDVYDEGELSLALDSKIQFCLASRDPDKTLLMEF
jgi:hypothetical protein